MGENLSSIVCDSLAIDEVYSQSAEASDLIATNSVEIAVVIGGDGFCRILDSTIECKNGDSFIFNCDLPHCFYAKKEGLPLRLIKIQFSPRIFEDNDKESASLLDELFKSGVPYSCSVLNSSAMSEILRLSGAIRREIDNRAAKWDKAIMSHLSLLLIALTRYNDLADAIEIERPKEWHIVFATMSEISRSYSDSSFSLSTVADRLFISRSSLSRAFSKVTGGSLHEYLQAVRMRKACALLETTDMSNEEIALACGIKDLTTFYNTFKNSYGTTPLNYKKLIKNRNLHIGESKVMVTIAEINENLQKGRAKAVKALTEQAIAEGASAEEILSDGLIAAMMVVGEKFKNNQVFVPEVLMAARAMNAAIEIIKPLIADGGFEVKGKVCIGTVRGDLHDIGKNLVKIMLESRGLEVIDLGVDVAPEKFVETAQNEGCRIICLSALLTTTMPVMGEVVKAAEAAGIRDNVKIMIGGAPVNEEFCRQIGADCYTVDAASAADAAVEFCKA